MKWLTTLRRNCAAKQCAQKLPVALVQGWGPAEFYTPDQIHAVISKLKLSARFIEIAYAAYLPENQYDQIIRRAQFDMTYADARALYLRYRSRSDPYQRWDAIGPSQGVMDYMSDRPGY